MKRSWLRALALGVAIGPASAPAAAEPADLDSAEIEEPSGEETLGRAVQGLNFHVWDEDPREAGDWAVELMEAGGRTAEAARWREIAVKSAVFPALGGDAGDDLEAELADWRELPAELAASDVSPLGGVLCLLPSLDRTGLVASWATSRDLETRLSLARALSAPFEAVGVRSAIDHLRADADPEVRRLARRAAAIRSASRG